MAPSDKKGRAMEFHKTVDQHGILIVDLSDLEDIHKALFALHEARRQRKAPATPKAPLKFVSYMELFGIFEEQMAGIIDSDAAQNRFGRLWGAVMRLSQNNKIKYVTCCANCLKHASEPADCNHFVNIRTMFVAVGSLTRNKSRFMNLQKTYNIGPRMKDDYELLVTGLRMQMQHT